MAWTTLPWDQWPAAYGTKWDYKRSFDYWRRRLASVRTSAPVIDVRRWREAHRDAHRSLAAHGKLHRELRRYSYRQARDMTQHFEGRCAKDPHRCDECRFEEDQDRLAIWVAKEYHPDNPI
jgi:hypothetical protein